MARRTWTLLCVAWLGAAAASVPVHAETGFHHVRVLRDRLWVTGSSGDETPAYCRRFKLSSAGAARWFARAKPVDRRYWFELLDWTHCSAEGTLVGPGGRRHRWELDYSGRGRVILSARRSIYLEGPELPLAP